MRTLLDTNILMDHFVRAEDYPDSALVVQSAREGLFEAWIASKTLLDIYYILRKLVDRSYARSVIQACLSFCAILPVRHRSLSSASAYASGDFEDRVLAATAEQFGLDCVVTRNVDHFQEAGISVCTPQAFLLRLSEKGAAYKVPFLDLKAQHHGIYNEVDDGITDVIASCGFVLGKHVEAFEQAFAAFHGVKHCVAVNSGTSALQLALMALDIGPGDAVLTAPHTFIATAEAISLVGAAPVFVDVDPESYTMDPVALADMLRNPGESRHAKAVIPVHLYGQPADMAPILKIAREHNLKVIEDACQAHGARILLGDPTGGGSVGLIRNPQSAIRNLPGWTRVGGLGDAGCFSFYPGKNLGAYGEGGAVTTNDDEMAERIRRLRDHGQSKKYVHAMVGGNFRMDAFQGVALGAKLKHLQAWNEARRGVAARYRELFEDSEIKLPREMAYAEHVYHLYVIQVTYRDALQTYLNTKGISTGLHYPVPLHLQKAYEGLGNKKGDFPVAERCAEEGLSLPMYPELGEEQIRYVVDAIRDFLQSEGVHRGDAERAEKTE